MAVCSSCGIQVKDGVKFCPSCGANLEAMAAAAPQQAPPPQYEQQAPPPQYEQQAPPPPQYQQQAPPPPQYQQQAPPPGVPLDEAQDAQQNKMWAVLGYVLFLIPLFAGPKNSKFARYHTNQGLNFLILWVILAIVNGIVHAAVAASVYTTAFWSGGWYGSLIAVNIVSAVVGVVVALFFILGLYNSLKGVMKPLPLIGKINILKVDM